MKHLVMYKWKRGMEAPAGEVEALYRETLTVPGIHSVSVRTNCVKRETRFDGLIILDMDREALEAYDGCEAHLRWKREYGDRLQAKAIIDLDE